MKVSLKDKTSPHSDSDSEQILIEHWQNIKDDKKIAGLMKQLEKLSVKEMSNKKQPSDCEDVATVLFNTDIDTKLNEIFKNRQEIFTTPTREEEELYSQEQNLGNIRRILPGKNDLFQQQIGYLD